MKFTEISEKKKNILKKNKIIMCYYGIKNTK